MSKALYMNLQLDATEPICVSETTFCDVVSRVMGAARRGAALRWTARPRARCADPNADGKIEPREWMDFAVRFGPLSHFFHKASAVCTFAADETGAVT
jgi:hypothetical protein